MIPDTSPTSARRTVPQVTVSSIAQELHERYPQELPLDHATKLVQVALTNRGYTNVTEESAVWSSNREQILHAIARHYEGTDDV